MSKQMGLALAILGGILIVGSVVSLNLPEISKWFPILLIGGGIAVYYGVKKYRWA